MDASCVPGRQGMARLGILVQIADISAEVPMKRMLIVAVIATLTLASSILTLAQRKTDFSRRWRDNQQLSDKATCGKNPTIFFPKQLFIHQTGAEGNVEARHYPQGP